MQYHRRGRAGILFSTHNQTLSEPIRLLQAIVLDEYAPDLRIQRDPIQGAETFFPAKNAHHKRAAFLAILFDIKNAPHQQLISTDHISTEYRLPKSAITKARAKMVRIGLIRKRECNWTFSTALTRTLQTLHEKIRAYQAPAKNEEERNRERLFVDMAKGAGNRE